MRSGLQAQAMLKGFFPQRVGKVRAGRIREAVRSNTGAKWRDLARILAGELDRRADVAFTLCIGHDYEDCEYRH